MRDGHYPYQTLIDAYGNNGFRFGGMSHQGSLLCLPTGMYKWQVQSREDVTAATLQPILEIADQVDVLFIGLGDDIAAFDPQLREKFRENQIIIEAISTASAISTYNVLLSEHRAVAAALVAVARSK